MKRVLVLAYRFPPQAGAGSLRMVKFARYLPEFGWQPEVLTVRSPLNRQTDSTLLSQLPAEFPIHTASAWYYRSLERAILRRIASLRPSTVREGDRISREQQLSTGLPVGDLAPPPEPQTRGASRRLYRAFRECLEFPDSHVGWVPSAVAVGRRLARANRYDAIFASTPPHSAQLAAAILTASTGVPLVTDLRDPWADLVYYADRPWKRRMMRALEGWVFRRSAAIVLNTEAMRDMVAAAHPSLDPRRFLAIPNGFDSSDFPLTPSDPATDYPLILHVGAVYERWGDPAELLRALAILAIRGSPLGARARVRFVGAGDTLRNLVHEQRIRDTGLHGRIELVDFVPHSRCVAMMKSAAILFLIQNSPHTPTQASSKLYEYLFAGPPILAITTSRAVREVLDRTRRGIAVPPGDPSAVASALDLLAAGGYARSESNETEVMAYERRALTARLAGALDAVSSDSQMTGRPPGNGSVPLARVGIRGGG